MKFFPGDIVKFKIFGKITFGQFVSEDNDKKFGIIFTINSKRLEFEYLNKLEKVSLEELMYYEDSCFEQDFLK